MRSDEGSPRVHNGKNSVRPRGWTESSCYSGARATRSSQNHDLPKPKTFALVANLDLHHCSLFSSLRVYVRLCSQTHTTDLIHNLKRTPRYTQHLIEFTFPLEVN